MKKANTRQKKAISELRSALDSAKSADEMLKVFRKLEARLEEKDLGSDCWKLAQQLHNEGRDPQKILSYGKRALNIVVDNEKTNNNSTSTGSGRGLGCHKSSLIIASILHLLGSACFELKMYDESLSYLNWSDRNLSKLVFDNYGDNFVLHCLHNTQLELCKVKKILGRGEEGILHLKKVLEIDEKTMEEGCIELGKANDDVSGAYLEVGNFEEALPFSLKALEIYKKHLGQDTRELTLLRMGLGAIYSALGEFEKAFEQNRLSLSGLKRMGNSSLLLHAETEGGHMLVALGRYEEAIEALKPVISQAETEGNQRVRALAFMSMARAFCRQEKFADARKYIKNALKILEKKVLNTGAVATGFMDMSKLYVEMKEYEAAISLLQKTVNIPELPQNYLADCSVRLFSLISLTGTDKKGISSLEEVVERLKKKFGPEHCHVGYGYANLGAAYMDLGRPVMAAERFVRAKDIFDVFLGPHHLVSLNASQTLSVAYADIKSYDLAIEIQEKVVEGFKGLGLSEQDKVDEAVQLLNIMKGRATGEVAESHTRALHQSEDGEDLSATSSQCGVSDDGKVI